ncbi:hypothetical protein [Nocardia asiatica]|uniref:hypothetical protein n=1 Tax=Nocardia asiatica TaxID=209252 RepID=UPI0012F93FF7|nr:hypothetical protein [Nocardia asiatica]
MEVEQRKRRPGRPPREDGPDYRTVGAKVPASLANLIKAPIGTDGFPTLKARVVTLVRDGLDSYRAQKPLGVMCTGELCYIGPIDLPRALGDEIEALMAARAFRSITQCLIEMLHRGLAHESSTSVNVPLQTELPLAPTGT